MEPPSFVFKPPDESLKITTKRPSWASRYPNAFMKAMRDNFRWKDDSRVTLYPDGADSFYFDASGSWPLCGGLILHDGIVRTPQGNLPKLYYSIHT